MTAEVVVDVLCVAGVLIAALVVIHTDNLNAAVMALSAVGVLLSVLFVVLDAPDVAHAEVVVGAITLPVLYLLAISRIRAAVDDRSEVGTLGEVGEVGERPAPEEPVDGR
jgi:energy-converting hydrogenase B subunit D